MRSMFDRIAGRYDLMNSVMTAGLHHRWRARAADLAALHPGDRALDVCCGTGDLALELRRRVGPAGEVVGLDFSDPMLELARSKSAAAGLAGRVPGRQCARAAVRGRLVRCRHRGLRGPERRRPGPGPGRDAARRATGRARGDPRDHDAAAAASELVLRGVVRPDRAVAGRRGRRGGRLQLPARLGAPFPARTSAGGRDGLGRPGRHSLRAGRGRHRGDPPRHGARGRAERGALRERAERGRRPHARG